MLKELPELLNRPKIVSMALKISGNTANLDVKIQKSISKGIKRKNTSEQVYTGIEISSKVMFCHEQFSKQYFRMFCCLGALHLLYHYQ